MTTTLLAKKLRELRAREGLSLTAASTRLGIGRHTLADLESGEDRQPLQSTLEKIAQGYGVPVEYLLAGEKLDATSPAIEAHKVEILEALYDYEKRLSPGSDWSREQGIQKLAEIRALISVAAVQGAANFIEDDLWFTKELVRHTDLVNQLLDAHITRLAAMGARAMEEASLL